jgi:hypothetical protein
MSPANSIRGLTLVIAFVAIIFAVPITQTSLELSRSERVQFTDVFRYRPTARALRQFEEALQDKSWFQQKLRPQVRRALFRTLRDAGPKGVIGLDGWVFYRPDLRYLVEPNHLELGDPHSKWVRPADGATQRDSVALAVAHFRDQLKTRGIELVVVPVPGKPGIYPDKLTRRAVGKAPETHSPTLELLDALRRMGVPTVNLFAVFQHARFQPGGLQTGAPLYLAQDTHWSPRGARLAAGAVASRIQALGLAPAQTREFHTQSVSVARWGDVLEMMQIPGLRDVFPPEIVECQQVLDPAFGPLVPKRSERPGAYRHPSQESSILVLGDSFCRIYQFPEPRSLGDLPGWPAGQQEDPGAKRLLPGSAGFISHLARELKSPVDAIVSDGGASTDVRRKLSTNPEILEGKRIVVWEFAEREIALGRPGWEDVPLPRRLD